MGVTSGSHSEDTATVSGVSGVVEPSAGQIPPRQIVIGQVGDTCVSCEAPLASDQRYCLNCGERRGRSRLAAVATGSQAEPSEVSLAADRPPPQRRRTASGTALIAGIATLLLAMGVGVEIGRISNGNSGGSGSPARASAPSVQVVTVGSGSGGSAGTTTSASAASTPNPKAKANHTKSGPTKVVVTKKVAAKATQAASKVLGASAKNLAPPTVKTGQSCSSGAGCQNGKFTGNFFGQ